MIGIPISALFDRTYVNFTCPCTLQSSDGETAELTFSLVNYTDATVDELYVTVGIVADEFKEAESEDEQVFNTAFLDTVALEVSVDPQSTSEPASYEIDLGVIPEGSYYFELLLHDANGPDGKKLLDSVWFKDLHQTPPTTLDLVDANYLVDSDGDGVGDLNEEYEGTDPSDTNSIPEEPTVDILFLIEDGAFEQYNTDAPTYLSHVVRVTNDMFEKSESRVKFRTVGVLDESTVPELISSTLLDTLRESQSLEPYLELLEAYQADLIAIYRPSSPFVCGFATEIGGLHGKGFLLQNERMPYIEVYLNSELCSIDTTPHEIGHLMGLGHSYEQFAVGAFTWSRGHAVYGEFGTIMSYGRQLFSGVGLDVFSSPHLDCLGKPCGVPHTEPNTAGSADAVLTLNVLKYQFAQRSTPDPEFDVDGDGFGAVADAFPTDPDEWADTDGDQFGDNVDAFPEDPLEWADSDGDGIGDNTDPDIDNDGIENYFDPNPFDPAERDLRLTAVASDEEEDQFGYFTTRIKDLDADGMSDLAVSAPTAYNENGARSGKVYFLPLKDVLSPALATDSELGVKKLSEVVSAGNSWELQGESNNAGFGEQLIVLDHANDSSELVVLSYWALYLITLDSIVLSTLDAADGSEDGQIDMAHCQSVDGCERLPLGSNFYVTDISSVADFDEDGQIDLGFVAYPESQVEDLFVYFLSRAALTTIERGDEEDAFTLFDIVHDDDSSFVLTTSGFWGLADLEFLGGTLASAKNDLVFGTGGNDEPGRLYVISGDQLKTIDEFDENGDRHIDIDSLVGLDQTYRISNANDASFGFSVDVLTDLDEDGRNDVLVWGDVGKNYVFTIGGIRFHDSNDESLDAKVDLSANAHEEFGTWLVNRLGKYRPWSSSGILRASQETSFDQFAFRYVGSMFVVGLHDLDFLDDPTGEDLNGVVNIPHRSRYPDVYLLRAPLGPGGPPTLAGVTSIGDLDEDAKADFVFAAFSNDSDGNYSTLYAVFTSELSSLDQLDGDTDHTIMLHNNMADIDGDGIPNLHDDDDDNDGLRDLWDAFPHLAEFRFDADRDGYANEVDAFPLDYFEHSDIDFDGIGDGQDVDADGDGIPNDDDEFPFDTDNDGLPNRDDPDDDNDMVLDDEDLFPVDPAESSDADSDGVGDNADEFDDDPNEAFDTDKDGIGNNADPDDDNDGYLDEDDAFPLDPTEWLDSDGDGFGDNTDVFPFDPLEWEDKDGDGLGDNHGSTAFSSYRLVNDWEDPPLGFFTIPHIEAHRLGDFDKDGLDDFELTKTLHNVTGQPWILLSSADLDSLDREDGQVDKVVQINRIHQGLTSWRFVNSQPGFDGIKLSTGNVGDLNGDGVQDIALSNSTSYDGSGSVTLVYGGGWSELDEADGQIDGEIDLHACVESKSCTRIRSDEPLHGFGAITTSLANVFEENQLSLALGSVSGQSRQLGRAGVGSSYLLSHEAIVETLGENQDGNVLLGDIEQHAQTYTFFRQFEGFLEGFIFAGRLPDLDQDSVDELMLFTPLSPTKRIYVLASSDLEGMDAADFDVDGKINLATSYRFPNSFRIDGFELSQINLASFSVQESINREQRSYFLPLLDNQLGELQKSHLVDLRHLTEHDSADGAMDSVVTTFDVSTATAWTFPNAGLLSVCKPDDSMDRTQVVGSLHTYGQPVTTSNPLELIVFDVEKLASLDSLDGTEDGSIALDAVLEQKTQEVWHLSFGNLTESVALPLVGCAGDFDGDGHEDIIVVLTHFNGQQLRGQILLIANADFPALDRLDGEEDKRVEVNQLWPND